MKIIHSRQPKAKRGFTLIELMVSMTVTMVIIGVLMAMTRVAVNGMVASQNATRYSRISQEVLGTVSKDLEGIVIRSGNPYEWVNVKNSGASGDDLGPASNANKQIKNPVEISFFTAATDRYNGKIADNAGDISLVRYKLVHQDVISVSAGDSSIRPVFTLYRQRIEPDEAFNTYLSEEVLPTPVEAMDGNDLLAENIYDMTISFNFEIPQAGGATIIRRIPIQVNGTAISATTALSIKGNKVTIEAGGVAEDLPSSARLASADISLLVLSDKGMNGLERANIDSTEKLSNYLKQHGKHFSKSVVLPRP